MDKKLNRTINIPALLKIGKGTLPEIGGFLKSNGFDKVVIYFGNGLIDMFGSTVMKSLEDNQIEILEYFEVDSVELSDITDIAFNMNNEAKAVIGIGGGKVLDAAKYSSFLKMLPFISVPTSSSTDGFSSTSASLWINNRKATVPAKMAYGIIADIDVIKSAPRSFLYSGIGDMVAKITALYDWQYEVEHGHGELNDCAVMIAKKAVNSFVRTPYDNIDDDIFLKELMDSLAMSGIANEIAGSSLPTSGSEHLISHALDKYAAKPQLHGVQVGIATYLMSMVQDHRYIRVRKVLSDTGFFDYVETLNLDVNEYLEAIDNAPSMKPFRHTYIHEEKYRKMAKEILVTDDIMKKIFHI